MILLLGSDDLFNSRVVFIPFDEQPIDIEQIVATATTVRIVEGKTDVGLDYRLEIYLLLFQILKENYFKTLIL